MTDAEKLRALAKWHDLQDDKIGYFGEREVQADLLRIADLLDAVPPETLAALRDGTWQAVPKEPTERMKTKLYGSCGTYADALAVDPRNPEECET